MPTDRRPALVAAFATIYVIWGSNYLAIKVLVGALPPLLVAGLRSASAGAILYAWTRAGGTPAPTRREWRDGTVAGALMFLGGHGALFWASQHVASGFAALIVATIPLWVAVLALPGGRWPTAQSAAGIALGLAGIAWLHLPAVVADSIRRWNAVTLLSRERKSLCKPFRHQSQEL